MGLLSSIFGGGSSSSSASSTSNTTENRDMRVVGGNGSINLSANDSTLSVVTTEIDAGAIDRSFSLADQALSLSTKAIGDSATTAIKATQSVFQGALDNNQATFQSALGSVTKAYENSATPENNQLKIAGFVVVGIAAVGLLMKAR